MFIVIRRKRLLGILCLTIIAVGGIIVSGNQSFVPVFSSFLSEETEPHFIIDAGHGGEDGGAVSSGGVAESQINLSIAKRVEGTLAFLGKNTAMTRSDDQAVYSDDAATLREKKRSDLKNRAAFINEYDNGLLISIHQNSLPKSPSVHGAQVFYNRIDGADLYAEQVQQALNEAINRDKGKVKKQIDSTIYLMRKVECPAILVECGFLSNEAETRRLIDNDYQKKLAVAIVAGVLRCNPWDITLQEGTSSTNSEPLMNTDQDVASISSTAETDEVPKETE